ncbi:hypothetical protein CSAL01_13082 [Colletotrichum salicis]|uniref:Uncharacterized protein n=1 Tax=Colletotrichum salicis TaxID=1209931 RepID=A0A135V042_9PEZI|nr:hypothetical protein CSAL01_13082 [Colletotrichum salicis]
MTYTVQVASLRSYRPCPPTSDLARHPGPPPRSGSGSALSPGRGPLLGGRPSLFVRQAQDDNVGPLQRQIALQHGYLALEIRLYSQMMPFADWSRLGYRQIRSISAIACSQAPLEDLQRWSRYVSVVLALRRRARTAAVEAGSSAAVVASQDRWLASVTEPLHGLLVALLAAHVAPRADTACEDFGPLVQCRPAALHHHSTPVRAHSSNGPASCTAPATHFRSATDLVSAL